jgi:transcription-repair coupling factor (superfamily II helicase)
MNPTAGQPAPPAVVAPLAHLPELLRDEPALTGLAGTAEVIAVSEAVRAFVIAGVARLSSRRPIVVVVPTQNEAERLTADLRQFLGAGSRAMPIVDSFPAWETLPFERVSPNVETMGRRLRVMWRLRMGGEHLPQVLVAPVRAFVQRLGPHVEDVEPIIVSAGTIVDRDDLVARLAAGGYRREYQVEARGEFAVRGSIVDVYPSTADHPVRIDLWGDEVERLQAFSVADQRATGDVDEMVAFPCRELLPTDDVRQRAQALVGLEPWGRSHWERLAEGQLFDGMESWLPWLTSAEHLLTDLVSPDALVLLVEPRRMRDRVNDLIAEEDSLARTLAQTWGAAAAGDDAGFPKLSLPFERLLAHTSAATWTVLGAPDGPATPSISGTTFDGTAGDAEALASRLNTLRAEGWRIVVAADGEGSAVRLRAVLAEGGSHLGPGDVVVAPLDRGFLLSSLKLAVIGEADLTGRRRVHRKARGGRRGQDLYSDLAPGNFVVHDIHGVGRYEGMVQRSIGGVERDYLLLAYKGGDRLYVPTDQVGTVRKYTGGETPTLHRLGGTDFAKTRSKVRKAVAEIAADLVKLYQQRMTLAGHAFGPDTPWQREMEDTFPYEETPDQAKAIDDVKADMEATIPMDRLVCGDVGYGKTEVAVRAAFKAVQDGKQVAVLVPTTLLANQHGVTFRERFAGFPVRVESVSRFLSTKEVAGVLDGLRAGEVDVVIGTHRLLSEDVGFKDLGLLVVDEEQRFGVSHKEKIKQLRAAVDVLTMTATPIPRTLEMSLTGIRDLSLVQTPPEDRQPILTYVGDYDERAVAEAIRRELLREGQVFFVHNRVADIEHVAADIRQLVPEARVCIAHGQMDEGSLEQVVLDFTDREYDVLVCTTIIESGIDMPTVNTLVVDRADLLGLAQLYQIRGRVGRSGQRAYAYLFHPPDRELTEEAYERLKTIGEFTDLGSGFKIAMRDLEIRGAGNLLGGAQSGHIAAVGFDLYCRMVSEAVAELKGEPLPVEADITIDVPVDANIPRDYISRDDLRMEAYRRLAAVASPADVDDIADEWDDRYGPAPEPALALLEVAKLRAECVRLGIREIGVQKGQARIWPLELKESQKVRLKRLSPKAIVKDAGDLIVPTAASTRFGEKQDPLLVVRGLVTLLAELVPA